MRIYISADIEGVAGVVARESLRPGGHDYDRACDWMTDTVLTACETLRELGASEVVVSDSHGNGQNIRFERMPAYVSLVRSWPRPLGMMQGIEVGAYDGALLIGYHAGATNPAGTLSHTISGEFFHEVRFNGTVLSEAGISAALGGHFGVPVLMIAGDDVAVAETRDLLGDIAGATLKTSYGFLSALSPSLEVAHERLRAGVRDAVGRIGAAKPYVIAGPVDLQIRLRTRFVAEWLSYLPHIERRDAFTIGYHARDVLAATRFLEFLTSARTAIG